MTEVTPYSPRKSGLLIFSCFTGTARMCGLFVSVGTSAQFFHLRARISVMERGCYLSQTKQSGELFCRSDTMRQRQLPTTYLKSQVRAARTSQSPFCHSATFPLSGESLLEAPKRRVLLIQFQSYSSLLLSHTPCRRTFGYIVLSDNFHTISSLKPSIDICSIEDFILY